MKYIYITVLGMILIISSCASFNKQLYSGEITRNLDSNYRNDSIQFYADLAGDHVQNTEKKELKRKLKTYDIKAFKAKVIEYFETIIDPYFDVFLFHFKNKEELITFISYKNFDATEDVNQSGQITIKDKSNFAVGKTLSKPDGSYVLLLSYAKDKTVEDYKLMNKEYTQVFDSIIYGEDYKKEASEE